MSFTIKTGTEYYIKVLTEPKTKNVIISIGKGSSGQNGMSVILNRTAVAALMEDLRLRLEEMK